MSIRKETRLNRKARRRHVRMSEKVRILLENCSCEIVDRGIINSDDILVLREVYSTISSRNLNYYPIPKRLNRKLRQYVHDHPVFFKDSLLEYITSGMVNSAGGLYSQLFHYNMEDLIRVLDSYRPLISSPSWL